MRDLDDHGDLRRAGSLLQRWWLLLIIPTLLLAGIGAGVGMAQPTTYTTRVLVEIFDAEDLLGTGARRTEVDEQLLAAQAELIQSEAAVTRVISDLGLDEPPSEVLRAVRAEALPNTPLIQIVVEGPDADDALRLAEALAHVYLDLRAHQIEDWFGILREQRERQLAALESRLGRGTVDGAEARALGEKVADIVTQLATMTGEVGAPTVGGIFRSGVVLTDTGRGEALANGVLAGFLGLLGGLTVAAVRERMDRRVHDPAVLGGLTGLEVSEIVVRLPDPSVATPDAVPPTTLEDLRYVYADLEAKHDLGRLLVVPADRDVGAAILVAGLATVAARSGREAIVVDANLDDRAVGASAVPERDYGLVDLLRADAKDARPSLIATGHDRLRHLPVGTLGGDDADVLARPNLGALISSLAQDGGVLIHVAPLQDRVDALWLTPHVDALLLVVRRDHTSTQQLRTVNRMLEGTQVRRFSVLVELG